VLSDEVYGITGQQPLSSPPRFAEVAQSLGGIAGLRVTSIDDLRTALIQLQRPSLIEAQVTERVWPGPSPFVDPASVRLAFAANASRAAVPGM
jgi:thiamine pyrophosphate-dependent acetolactate synthase large subunit-like protein